VPAIAEPVGGVTAIWAGPVLLVPAIAVLIWGLLVGALPVGAALRLGLPWLAGRR
jgi:hypothetical protein